MIVLASDKLKDSDESAFRTSIGQKGTYIMVRARREAEVRGEKCVGIREVYLRDLAVG
jgi:hypothetical protein